MINDNDFRVGRVIEFVCNGNGRGDHFRVAATITKVNPKTVKAVECNRSYRPGTRWVVDKTEVDKLRDPTLPAICYFCKGTGSDHDRACAMCKGTGVTPHETYSFTQEAA